MVVKGNSLTLALVKHAAFRKVDLPLLGLPTIPISTIIFSLLQKYLLLK